MSDFKTYTRICVDCGKVLCNVGRSAQRCPECGKSTPTLRVWNGIAVRPKQQKHGVRDLPLSAAALPCTPTSAPPKKPA